MDTGKILIGFAFILLSVALMVSPSSAEMQGLHYDAGCVEAWPPGQTTTLSAIPHVMPAPVADPTGPEDLP